MARRAYHWTSPWMGGRLRRSFTDASKHMAGFWHGAWGLFELLRGYRATYLEASAVVVVVAEVEHQTTVREVLLEEKLRKAVC